MNITILGATGKSGRFILKEALDRGHAVTVFVRNPQKLGELTSKVKVISGDVADVAKLQEAISGSQVVISALGHVSGSRPRFQTDAMRSVVASMQAAGTRRLIDLTGSGVPAAGDHPKFMDKLMTTALSIVSPDRIQDGAEHVKVITDSDLDWTIVRTPLQVDSGSSAYVTGKVGDSQLDFKAPRAAIAKFILDIVEQSTFIRELPVITGKK